MKYGIGSKIARRLIRMAAIVFIIISGISPTCYANQDVIEKLKSGSVNWTLGTVSSKGLYVPEENNSKKTTSCEIALAKANTKARHNLLEAVKAILVENDITIGEFAGKDNVIMAKLMDMINQAPVIQQKYITDGTAEVTVEMTMFGGLSQLVLPIDVMYVESIQPVETKHNNTSALPDNESESLPGPNKEIYSGLIVDARGLRLKQVMTPKILDENREEVYGPAFVSREIAVQKGLCHYETDIAVARNNEKAANNPLMVKGLRLGMPYKTDIIISNSDALKLKSSSEHLMFLKKCRVIIVVDPIKDSTNQPQVRN